MAKGQPIRWNNVTINNGSSAASFGSVANQFGRSASQGLDIFSQQMQERVNQEDERLTNEAIATALRGGPVSTNRRVDQNLLQQAIERRGSYDLDQELGALDVTGKGLTNQLNQFKVDNYAEDRDHQIKMDESLLATQEAQRQRWQTIAAREARTEAEAQALKANTAKVEDILYNQRPAQIRADLMNNPDIQAARARVESGELSQEAFDNILNQEAELAIAEQERNPDYLPGLYRANGVPFADFLGTAQGQEWNQARQLRFQNELEEGSARLEQNTKNRGYAREFQRTGDTSNLIYDPSVPGSFTFGEGKSYNDNDAKTYAERAGYDLDDDEHARAVNHMKTTFKDAGSFRAMIGNIINDGELVDNWEDVLAQAQMDADGAANRFLNDGAYDPNLSMQERIRAAAGIASEPANQPARQTPAQKRAVDLNERLTSLELPNVEIHPDKDSKVNRDALNQMLKEVESGRRNGRIPLSQEQMELRRAQLISELERLSKPNLDPTNFNLFNNPVQPK